MRLFLFRAGWSQEHTSGGKKTCFSPGSLRTILPTLGDKEGLRFPTLLLGGASEEPALHRPVFATPMPQAHSSSPGRRANSGGLAQDASRGPFFCLYHPFFVPLSPGLKGQHLWGQRCHSWAWAETLQLFVD